MKKYHLKLFYIFGNFTHGYECSFISNVNSWKSDLFFMKHNYSNKKSYISSHVPYARTFYYYEYPLMDTLCSGYFLGHKINVPCRPLDMILADYGPNWMVPVESNHWDYASSGFNRGPPIKWDKSMKQSQSFA